MVVMERGRKMFYGPKNRIHPSTLSEKIVKKSKWNCGRAWNNDGAVFCKVNHIHLPAQASTEVESDVNLEIQTHPAAQLFSENSVHSGSSAEWGQMVECIFGIDSNLTWKKKTTTSRASSLHEKRPPTSYSKSSNNLRESLSKLTFSKSIRSFHEKSTLTQSVEQSALRIYIGSWNMHGKVSTRLYHQIHQLCSHHPTSSLHFSTSLRIQTFDGSTWLSSARKSAKEALKNLSFFHPSKSGNIIWQSTYRRDISCIKHTPWRPST